MNPLRLLILAVSLITAAASASADDKVSLQLKWRNAFQFAGFYMALEKGYYRDEGLDVSLLEGGPGIGYIEHVLKPGANYSVADSSALLARAEGQPIRAVACIFQHSPLALLVLRKSGIRTFENLRGKRIMMQPELNADILAALKKAGVGRDDFVHQEISYNIRDLIDGNTDAYAAYLTDQPHQLDRLGVAYRILRPGDYGIDFYGDTLITSDKEVRRHPGRVNAMVHATARGWIYALDHPFETVDLILGKYNTQHFTPDQLQFEAEATARMIIKDVVQVGYMSDYRWQKIADTYAAQGLVPKNFDIAAFIYRPQPGFVEIVGRYRWLLAATALLLLLFVLSLHTYLLRRTVRARTESLQAMEARFHEAQKMEAIGTLVGGIAHDFNNMLAGITGNLYLARSRARNQPAVVETLEKAERISMQAAEMISQLLTFANRGVVEKQVFPLTTMLKETMKLQRVSIPENIRFESLLCNEALQVCADATQLQQVLLNLLANARDAIADVADPSIQIRLEPYTPDAAFLKRHPGQHASRLAHLQISDNGHGIRPEHIHNIFEPFFTTKEVGKGTGLGLAMVFGAVQSNNGIITVESEPGVGSTFHVYLPLADVKAPAAGVPAESGTLLHGNGETILLADDEPMVIEASEAVLHDLGYRTVTARNGLEAVNLFTSTPGIALAMLDVVMPVMKGPEAAEKIRAISPGIPIIFATGYDPDASFSARGIQSEIVLRKPFDIAKLSQLLRQLLEA